jgi:hypothetical protein
MLQLRWIIALEKSICDTSLEELEKVLDIGLRTENDHAIALLNIAHIEYGRENHEKAKDYQMMAIKYKSKPIVQSEIKKFQEKINVAFHLI